MGSHFLGFLELGVRVLEVGGDAGAAKGVIADGCVEACSARAPANHVPGLGSIEAPPAQPAAIAGHGLEEGRLGVRAEAGDGHVGDEVGIQGVMTGHEMALSAFLGQADVEAVLFAEEVADVECEGGTDAGEGIDHEGDQGAVALARDGILGDAGEQDAGLVDGQHGRGADLDAV